MKFIFLLSLFIFTFSSFASECTLDKRTLKKLNTTSGNLLKSFLIKNLKQNTPNCRAKMLAMSIKKKDQVLIDFFINDQTNLNYKGPKQDSNPTHMAIIQNDYKTLRKILNHGANPNLIIKDKSLLDIAEEQKTWYSRLILEEFNANKRKKCSLKDSMIPKCYHDRKGAVLKIALIYYGDSMTLKDLNRIEPILKQRFNKSTNGAVKLDVISKKIIKFQKRMPKDYKFNNITDKKRLQRIWYYDNIGSKIMNEVYSEYKKVTSDNMLNRLDAIVGITGAQFDGLGFASGRVSVTEYPQEVAWSTDDQGWVDYPSDYKIVDELIHELGHNMHLGHTSTQCTHAGLSLSQRDECCEQSPSKNDVLSYCRKRPNISESFMHGFESCSLDKINELVVPAMLSGGDWHINTETSCE